MRRLLRFQNAEGKDTPPALLRQLREIDATAELVYVGGGTWWLGTVRTNEERAEAGRFILDFERKRDHPNPRNVMLGHLLQEGFARIEAYETTGDPAGTVTDSSGHPCTIVEDFRERDYHWRKDQGREVVKARAAASAGEDRKRASRERGREYLLNDGRDKYRREVRDRVQFGHGGMTGGSIRRHEGTSRIITLDQFYSGV